jgi:hypothetical protein
MLATMDLPLELVPMVMGRADMDAELISASLVAKLHAYLFFLSST